MKNNHVAVCLVPDCGYVHHSSNHELLALWQILHIDELNHSDFVVMSLSEDETNLPHKPKDCRCAEIAFGKVLKNRREYYDNNSTAHLMEEAEEELTQVDLVPVDENDDHSELY